VVPARDADRRIDLATARAVSGAAASPYKEAHGEFDSECAGYSGAQDTFYVGTAAARGWCRGDAALAQFHNP